MLTKCEKKSEYTDDTYQVFFSVSCSEDNICYLIKPNLKFQLRSGSKFTSTSDLPMDIDEGHSLLAIVQYVKLDKNATLSNCFQEKIVM